ncbi:hypothetical protein LCGC14_0958010 [marine sediment metagenome]|uniref:HNH nuclease domain-containing protein n=1 Tax=marine sediment metagenome TaxID=412755 RepID=A0A0F9QYJ6_9ZZZZ
MPQKLTYEFVKDYFENKGYELLSRVYIGSNSKLEYVCPEGHQHNITWRHFYSGQGCFYCSNNVKPIIEFIRQYFENEGHVLLTKAYINAQQKLKYICADGHRNEIKWNNFKDGSRCSTCKSINMSGDKHHAWKGGISNEPYCDVWADKEYKEDIKARDNYECQNPDCWKITKKLCLHHIDYDKKNCHPSNLIILCRSCNGRANSNRERHTNYYNGIMKLKNL